MLWKFLIWISALILCLSVINAQTPQIHVVPMPKEVKIGSHFFVFNAQTAIYYNPSDEEKTRMASRALWECMCPSTGFSLIATSQERSANILIFRINQQKGYAKEAYSLQITPKKIEIEAATQEGLFYGIQTLLQLLPAEVRSTKRINAEATFWQVPALTIKDEPAFPYRGAHLDVARHFFPLDSVKRYVDHLARYKLNRLHWHLTDDGWRLEIKQYPKLMSVASCCNNSLSRMENPQQPCYKCQSCCQYYTQEEARELVRYAAERGIEVIPEIEMPGHAKAVLAAYPEYGCDSTQSDSEIFCPYESTFTFLENILTEVMDIFPSKMLHIGGDECERHDWKKSIFCQNLIERMQWKDENDIQKYFTHRIENFVHSKGRRIIGWDEILEENLDKDAVIMAWRDVQNGIDAALQGYDVIMTPYGYAYLDLYQADSRTEPQAQGNFLPLQKVYSFEVIPNRIPKEKQKHILGFQSNLWTELIPAFSHLQYMLLPRLLAVAENGWTPQAKKNWENFCNRIPYQLKILEIMKIPFGNLSYDIHFHAVCSQEKLAVSVECGFAGTEIAYTTDGSEPTLQSPRYTAPILIEQNTVLKAVAVQNEKITTIPQEITIHPHRAVCKKGSASEPEDRYKGAGQQTLFDGIRGTNAYNDGYWQGFHGKNAEIFLDLEMVQNIKKVNCSALQNSPAYIVFPDSVSVQFSNDGKTWTHAGTALSNINPLEKGVSLQTFSVEFPVKTQARHIKVVAHSMKYLLEGHSGTGDKAWIFLDEIEVE